MDLSDNDRALIIEWAARHSEIRKVWFFGSRARGTHRPDSDIDLGIEVEGETMGERDATWAFAEWREELRLSHEVDQHLYDPEDVTSDYVGPGVRRDGVLIYEAKTEL